MTFKVETSQFFDSAVPKHEKSNKIRDFSWGHPDI